MTKPAGTDSPIEGSASRRRAGAAIAIVSAALLMGLPTLRGGFVGGDDRQLVLNHVLVNHPSIAHALELFTIIHRDLYQPIPLLTFSGEFAAAGALGLLDHGIDGASWLFHLTNVLLHAANALLVWLVIAQWYGPRFGRRFGPGEGVSPDAQGGQAAERVALIAALIFAVHPLQVEVVAWINGRMMLLSTLFFLASLWSQEQWLRRRRWGWLLVTLLFVAISGMSKVRVSLPFVLALYCLVRRIRVSRGLVALWVLSALVTAALAWVNIRATAEAGMFEGAASSLQGPRAARVALSLAWYWTHYVWPAGLAAWYPSPEVVAFSDAGVLRALGVVLPVLALIAWAARRRRLPRLAFGWFFLTLAATLPIVPSRGTLAADRYMYLPIIGLVWATSAALLGGLDVLPRRWRRRSVRRMLAVIGCACLAVMIALSRHVGSFYETYLSKTQRLADLFPDTPHVWERVAWSYFSLGDYAAAIRVAKKEFVHDDPELRADALGVLGMAQIKMGEAQRGIDSLARAVESCEDNLLARHRLARALADSGQTEGAIEQWERVARGAPAFNPALHGLAEAWRARGDAKRARALYSQALTNNTYDVSATLGLAQIDIEENTAASLAAARRRLRALLNWMPENHVARINLGVVAARLGDPRAAAERYRQVLEFEPHHATALVNLAELYRAAGQPDRAAALMRRAGGFVASLPQAVVIHDFFADQGLFADSVALWRGLASRLPAAADAAKAFEVWSAVCAGGDAQAAADAEAQLVRRPDAPLPLAAAALGALRQGRGAAALLLADRLAGEREGAVSARRRLLAALQRFDAARPGAAWTFCIAATLLLADGQVDAAIVSVDLCAQNCADASCKKAVDRLEITLANAR